MAIIEVGKNPFIQLLGQELGKGSIILRKEYGYSLYRSRDIGCRALSL